MIQEKDGGKEEEKKREKYMEDLFQIKALPPFFFIFFTQLLNPEAHEGSLHLNLILELPTLLIHFTCNLGTPNISVRLCDFIQHICQC